jgi:membrane-associated protein
MITEIVKTVTDPQLLLSFFKHALNGWWLYLILFFWVFAETGLLIGFFLPGDSLLFTLGVIAGVGELNLFLIIILLCAAAIFGDSVGFALGKRFGKSMNGKPDTWYFKKDYIQQTREFFQKHGGKTIVYSRFVPIVRTFAPFVAGAADMDYSKFISFNIIGGIVWVLLLTLLGYFLGNLDIVKANFEKVILLIILVSFVPTILEIIRRKLKSR